MRTADSEEIRGSFSTPEEFLETFDDRLQRIKAVGGSVTDISITTMSDYGGGEYGVLEIGFQREETEKEKSQREEMYASAAEFRRRQYDALKKEFEGNK